jgi:hypothetical protein
MGPLSIETLEILDKLADAIDLSVREKQNVAESTALNWN